MTNYVEIAFTLLFSQNLLLVCAFAFGSDPKSFSRPKEAFLTGLCLTVVLLILTPVSRVFYGFLEQYELYHYEILVYSLWGVFGCHGLAVLMEKISPPLWKVVGDSLGSLPSNGAVLAVLFLCGQEGYGWKDALVFAFFAGLGVLIALVSLVGIRQNSELHHSPSCFQGMPILFITAGLMSLAFLGYYGNF